MVLDCQHSNKPRVSKHTAMRYTSRIHQIRFGGVHLPSTTWTAPTQLSAAIAFQKGVVRRPPPNSRKSCWFCRHTTISHSQPTESTSSWDSHLPECKPVSISLLELVYLTVPAQHLKCLIEGCSPPVTCEPGWVLGSSCDKFYPRALISTSEWFHNVTTYVIPATQQAQHTAEREANVLHVHDRPCDRFAM